MHAGRGAPFPPSPRPDYRPLAVDAVVDLVHDGAVRAARLLDPAAPRGALAATNVPYTKGP
ncbi:hypothetical protein [Streptomyces albiaxialis]|uniref:hypothetical protein n=1 Tax=Streptomyces albiaxialis TaxID=329523 RepID=UPI0031D93788